MVAVTLSARLPQIDPFVSFYKSDQDQLQKGVSSKQVLGRRTDGKIMFIHGLMDHPPPEQSPGHPAGKMLMVPSAPLWDDFSDP